MIKLPFLSFQVQIWLFRTSADICAFPISSDVHKIILRGLDLIEAKKLLQVLVQSERTLSTTVNSMSSTRKIT